MGHFLFIQLIPDLLAFHNKEALFSVASIPQTYRGVDWIAPSRPVQNTCVLPLRSLDNVSGSSVAAEAITTSGFIAANKSVANDSPDHQRT